jgi:hypothetical protein
MEYTEFRDTIRRTIDEADKPLTWTEIRMIAKLPQALPNGSKAQERSSQ